MLEKTGVPGKEQIRKSFPDKALLVRPKAILECYEDIPCNPCSTSCPFDAIEIGAKINQQPVLKVDLCTGCALCVPSCPGIAIMTAQIKDHKAVFKIPYEFLPLPKKGEVWKGLDRFGQALCEATIEHVLLAKPQDRTAVVTVSVPVEHLYTFSTIEVKHG